MSNTNDHKSLKGVVCGDWKMSHEDYGKMTEKARTVLLGEGVKEGDFVAICMHNDIPILEAAIASGFIGAYSTPINGQFSPSEFKWVLDDCGAKVLVIHTDLWHKFKDVIAEEVEVLLVGPSNEVRRVRQLSPSDLIMPEGGKDWHRLVQQAPPCTDPRESGVYPMAYTAGTTGKPKGVKYAPMSKEVYEQRVAARAAINGCGPGDRVLIPGPMYHSGPYFYALQASRRADLTVIVPKFDAEELLATVEKYAITSLRLTPILYQRLLALPEEVRNRYDVSSLRFVAHTSAPCSHEVKKQMIDWVGPVVYEFYSSTEAGLIAVANTADALKKPGTSGKPVPGRTIKILDDHGNELPQGESGHIYASNLPLDFTYHNNSDARAAMERDGMITIGDIGYLDEDGYLFIVDRAKDIIISGGAKIAAREVEEAIGNNDKVFDCAVIGIPDEEFGEAIMAHVQPHEGATVTDEELRDFLDGKIARFKIPKGIKIVDSLPREDSGKIYKRLIRDSYWAEHGRNI